MGRLRLGVGRGGPWVDLEVFGTGLRRYEEGFAESLDLLLAGLTRERAGARGQYLAFREVAVVPRTVSRPHPPVVVAATSRATAELAASRGLPLLLGMHAGDAEKREMLDHYDHYDQAARALGRDPAGVGHVSTVLAHVADTRDQAVAELRGAMPGWLAEGLAGHQSLDDRPRQVRDPLRYTDLLCSLHPVGSADECVARLRAGVEHTGIRHVIMMVEGTGDPARTAANIARLGTEVLPRLRD